jgi:hypothetical protein
MKHWGEEAGRPAQWLLAAYSGHFSWLQARGSFYGALSAGELV